MKGLPRLVVDLGFQGGLAEIEWIVRAEEIGMTDEKAPLVRGGIDKIIEVEAGWVTVETTVLCFGRAQIKRHPDVPTLVILE